MSTESEKGEGRGLPVGVEWHPAGRQSMALRRGLYVLAIANLDGTWTAIGGIKSEAPAADGAAAQREAEAALWRAGVFGDVAAVDAARAPAEPAPLPWNWCQPCNQAVDVDDDTHEGDRTRCNGCRGWYVVCRDGDGVWSLQSEAEHDAEDEGGEPAPSREPSAPADGDELARLLAKVPSALVQAERDRMLGMCVREPRETAQDVLAATVKALLAERERLTARAEEADRKLADVADLQRSTAADLDATRAQLRIVQAGRDDVWRWQGDGGDDPASLACPVVMSASTLREFVAARERVAALEAERGRFVALFADMNGWWSAHNELAGTAKDPGDARYQEGKAHGILHCLTAVEGVLSGKAERTREPAGHRVAALLAKVEEARAEAARDAAGCLSEGGRSDGASRRDAYDDAASLICATLGAPSPLDAVVADVCAVRLTGSTDATSDDLMSNIGDLAFEARAGQMRNRFLVIGRLALAGALVRGEEEKGEAEEERAAACDAKGGA